MHTDLWKEVPSQSILLSRTVFITKTSDIDNNGRIIRSPDALRPLTLCSCDCELLTSAICRGLQWYTIRCIHFSQRCISFRQMTDNIFRGRDYGLGSCCVTDFAAAYPSANHSWIFSVIENTGLPAFPVKGISPIQENSM